MAELPSVTRWKREATMRGALALGTTAGSIALWSWIGWIPGVGGLAVAGWLTYRWFMWRAKHGLRF